jgi:hypothetical protein
MTSYAEINRKQRGARPLFIELKSLGLRFDVHEALERPSGYHVEVLGLEFLSPAHANRVQRRVEEHTPGLLKVLWARWDADLEAVRREGAACE